MCSGVQFEEGGGENYRFKVLVPNSVIGEVMGPEGSIISHLEKDTGARMFLSGSSDLYPGTEDRVCLLTGNMESILSANYFIMVKTSGMRNNYHLFPKKLERRPGQVKIIIPQCSVPKIVGKRGKTIDRLKQQSGCSIKISQRTFNPNLREMCVIVCGDVEQRNVACREILKLVAVDTNVPYYLNISYANVDFPVPNAYVTGSPFAKIDKKMRHIGPKPNGKATTSSAASSVASSFSLSEEDYFQRIKTALAKLSFTDRAVCEACKELSRIYDQGLLDICYVMLMNLYYPGNIFPSITNEVPSTNVSLPIPAADLNALNTLTVPPLNRNPASLPDPDVNRSMRNTNGYMPCFAPTFCDDPNGVINAESKFSGSGDTSVWNTNNPLAGLFNNRQG